MASFQCQRPALELVAERGEIAQVHLEGSRVEHGHVPVLDVEERREAAEQDVVDLCPPHLLPSPVPTVDARAELEVNEGCPDVLGCGTKVSFKAPHADVGRPQVAEVDVAPVGVNELHDGVEHDLLVLGLALRRSRGVKRLPIPSDDSVQTLSHVLLENGGAAVLVRPDLQQPRSDAEVVEGSKVRALLSELLDTLLVKGNETCVTTPDVAFGRVVGAFGDHLPARGNEHLVRKAVQPPVAS